jgi:hypothetical protein
MIIKYCDDCQIYKRKRGKRFGKMMTFPLPIDIYQMLSLDIIGPVINENSKRNFILLIVDRLTRFVWSFLSVSMPDTDRIIKSLITIKPANSDFQTTKLLSGCGLQFDSHKWLDFCKHNNITNTNTSIYYPQGDGITERQGQSLLTKLRILNKGKRDWTPTLV